MTDPDDSLLISSLKNPRVKQAVKLRRRPHRDKLGLTLIEGYREIKRALDNEHPLSELFFCPSLFLGVNEPALLASCRDAGTQVLECSPAVFAKMSYRDRPDGLLAVAPQIRRPLDSITPSRPAMIVVAEAIEKPGNLGTILRSCDGTGADAVFVCDRCTDINNPNVIRASIGTCFSLPVVETLTEAAIEWLRAHEIRILAATPHAEMLYADADLTASWALVVGTEQHGLSDRWLNEADLTVRIPMLGQCDSLNVASATTILLYEAIRQRSSSA